MMITMFRYFLLFLVLFFPAESLRAEAAYGQTEDHRHCWPSVEADSDSEVSVMVLDERPYIVSGDKLKTFVGLSRSQYGIPYDIHTVSNGPLARDLEQALVNGLLNSGILASVVGSRGEFNAKGGGDIRKLLILTLKEWKSDRYRQTSFEYDISVVIYNQKGMVLGTNSLKDKKDFPSGVDGGRATLTELLGGGGIEKAWSGGTDTDTDQIVQKNENQAISEHKSKQASNGLYADLNELKELLDNGILTQQEFDEQKRKILSRE